MTTFRGAPKKNNRLSMPVFSSLVIFGLIAAAEAQTWTQISPAPTSEDLMGIVFAMDRFVAVGTNGAVLTSSDGNAWTFRTSGVSKTLFAVGASDSMYVAVGDSGTILTSKDGIAWTARTSNTTNSLQGVAWNGLTFVAAGLASTIVTSADGASWTNRTLGAPTDLHGVAWGNNMFAVAGFDGMNGTINTSPDGIHWTGRTVQAPDGLLSISWCGSAFLAGSIGVLTSPDGLTWDLYTSGFSDYINGATGYSNRFIVVGAGGVIESSSDDSAWTSQNSGVTASLYCVTWGANLFVAAGAGGAVLTSPLTNASIKGTRGLNGRRPAIAVNNHGVNFSLVSDAIVSLRLYSTQGRLVRSMSALLCKGDHAAPATFLSGLSQGRYLLSFKAGSYTIDRPVLVVK
ncbi:MAG: hypothetical protein WBM07_01785 [Chitinivibrionales bacterium]